MHPSIGDLPSNSERVWYIITEEAHQGPFSFSELERQRLAASTKIWAKGWPVPLAFEVLVMAYHPSSDSISPPPLPRGGPREATTIAPPVIPPTRRSLPWVKISGLLVLVAIGGGIYWQTRPPQLQRPEGLPLPAFREMRAAFKRQKDPGPLRAIGVSADYRRLWMADKSRQDCSADLSLSSKPTDNLSGEAVSLQAEASTKAHWIQFENWSFLAGQKLWPGRYTAVLNRIDCRPQFPWSAPEADSVITFSVDIYTGPKRDLVANLAALRKLKRRQEQKARQALVMGWRDVEEKCRTLSAISVQIQQGFASLLDAKIPWRKRYQSTVDRYTLRFGGFLTNFTVRNEEDFNRLGRQEVLSKVKLMERGPLITNYARRIGFLSMELIEWLQKGVPRRNDLISRLKTYNEAMEKVRQELDAEAIAAQAVYASGSKSD